MLARFTHRSPGSLALTLALVALTIGAPASLARARQEGTLGESERSAVARVNGDAIRRVTTDLSAPQMEGRGTGQPGGDRAAKYIAERFAELGLRPLGDAGTFLQAVGFHAATIEATSRVTSGDVALAPGKDFVVAPPFPAKSVDVAGALAFVGFGIVSTDLGRDDLAGVEVKGKVALILAGRPKSADEAAWKKSGGVASAVATLGARGAAAVLVATEGDGAFAPLADRYGRRRVTLAGDAVPAGPPVLYLTTDAAARLLAGTGAELADARKRAEAGEAVARAVDRRVAVSLVVESVDAPASNVVGVVDGSDPKLKAEAVVYTAHWDAYGVAKDGRVYPGAADNALGVAEMLAVAEAIAKAPAKPRRSVVFIAVAGEEYGLLGSRYWAEHPTWPLARVAANINLDGVGTETYGPVGKVHGFGEEFSDLGTTLRSVAASFGAEPIPDPIPEQGIFARGDQFTFAKKGVPAINILGIPAGDTSASFAKIFAWVETSYHQPGDTIRAEWDWSGPKSVASIGLLLGLRVASADAMPAWAPGAPYARQ